MSYLSRDAVQAHLRSAGISDPETLQSIANSFAYEIGSSGNLVRGPYLRHFDEGEVLYQYIRNPSSINMIPGAGNYFGIKGATMDGLAITSGMSGRQLYAFVVASPFVALEGNAAEVKIDLDLNTRPPVTGYRNGEPQTAWDWDGGGKGGATQIFIPNSIVRSHLEPRGAAL